MKLLFKQRFFSWLDSYDIYDETGKTVYTVEGELSWGHLLNIYDNRNNHVATIKEKVLTFLPKFLLYANGNYIGSIRKELAFFGNNYNIDFCGWHVEGDWLGWDYTIKDGSNNVIAQVNKELFHLTDHYVIDVKDSSNALYALLLVLAIDIEKCSNGNK